MKIHVRRFKDAGHEDTPACAENARGYKHLPADRVLSAKEFRAAPAAERCQHCENLYLIIRNKQRKAKGLAPVATAFEGLAI